MSSERKRLANQRNAQKSTGPKTAEGKVKSRRNALKHGLSGAGIVMRRADEKKLAQRIEDWRAVLAPIHPIEETLVERAALAAVRCESAVRQEAAARRRRVKRALSRREARKRKEISALLDLLQTEPGRARRQLKQPGRGLAWLIDEWKALADRLKSRGFFCCADAALVLRLLGKEPEMPYPDDTFVASLRKAILGALPEIDLEAAEACLGLQAGDLDRAGREAAVSSQLPEPAEARKFLRSVVARELRRLRSCQAAVAHDEARTEAFERSELVACAQVGTDTEAYRLHRYEFTQEMSLHRNLNELIRIRKQEPDLASIARWEKTGKKYNRRWDGYSWVPNSEWRVAEASEAGVGDQGLGVGGPGEVAGGGWRVAGGREGGSTEVEPSPVTGPDTDPQATPRVAGFSALREPGASQPQLPPGDLDPLAQEPVSASLADAGVGDWGSGVGEEKTRTDAGLPMPEEAPMPAPVSHPSSAIGHSPSSPQPLTPNPQPLTADECPKTEQAAAAPVSQPSSAISHRSSPIEANAIAQNPARVEVSAHNGSCPQRVSQAPPIAASPPRSAAVQP